MRLLVMQIWVFQHGRRSSDALEKIPQSIAFIGHAIRTHTLGCIDITTDDVW